MPDEKAQLVLIFMPLKSDTEASLDCLFSGVLLSGLCDSVFYSVIGACTAGDSGGFMIQILLFLSGFLDVCSPAIPSVPGKL